MLYFHVRFDLPSGKENDFKEFLERARKFWLAQPGVREFHVYGDMLIDWPERVISIGVNDRQSLQRILDSAERQDLRQEMLSFVKRPAWQLLELQKHGYLDETISINEAAAV